MPWLPSLFGSVSHLVRRGYYCTGFHDADQPIVFHHRKADRSGGAAAKAKYTSTLRDYVAGWPGATWRGLETVRLRLVHAQVRRHLLASEEWDHEAHGMPISAAHIALASCNFSGMLLRSAMRIGARLNDEERDSFMQIWRYTAHLMGVPEALMFSNETEACEIYRVGYICEPPPGLEAIAMANSVIASAPYVIGIEDEKERDNLSGFGYRLSRALIGDELADQLMFPKSRISRTGTLVYLRLRRRIQDILNVLLWWRPDHRAQNFMTLLNVSTLEEHKISYRLPDKLHADEAKPW